MKEYRKTSGRGTRGPSTEKKPGPPWPGPGTDPGGLYTCICVSRSWNCIQVSIVYRYTGMQCRGPRALRFAKALKFRFSAKKSPFCDLSVRSEKSFEKLQNVIKIIYNVPISEKAERLRAEINTEPLSQTQPNIQYLPDREHILHQ